MLAQRSLQQSVRRLAAQQPGRIGFLTPAAIATSRASFQWRQVATEKLSNDDNYILRQQRLSRPVSPHLSIYRPQITWFSSMFNRLTGVALGGVFYLYGISYLVAPTLGWHIESASIAAAFATWPVIAKVLTKFTLALPFTFHSLNGVRHLVWDFAMGLKNQQVNATGWTVVGLSVVSALGLALI